MNDELQINGLEGDADEDVKELESHVEANYEKARNEPFTTHPPQCVVSGSPEIKDVVPVEKTEEELISEVLDEEPEKEEAKIILPAEKPEEDPENPYVPADNEMARLKAQLAAAQARADAAVAETERLRSEHATLGDGSLSRKEEINVITSRETERLGRCPTADEMEEITASVDTARGARRVSARTRDTEFTPNKPPKKAVTAQDVRGRDSEHCPHKAPRAKKEKGWV